MREPIDNKSIIIIGAGISGLSFAHYSAAAGLKAIVLERDDRIGGTFHTHRIAGNGQKFWIELRAHTCYNSYGRLIGIIEDCAILDNVIPRQKVG